MRNAVIGLGILALAVCELGCVDMVDPDVGDSQAALEGGAPVKWDGKSPLFEKTGDHIALLISDYSIEKDDGWYFQAWGVDVDNQLIDFHVYADVEYKGNLVSTVNAYVQQHSAAGADSDTSVTGDFTTGFTLKPPPKGPGGVPPENVLQAASLLHDAKKLMSESAD